MRSEATASPGTSHVGAPSASTSISRGSVMAESNPAVFGSSLYLRTARKGSVFSREGSGTHKAKAVMLPGTARKSCVFAAKAVEHTIHAFLTST